MAFVEAPPPAARSAAALAAVTAAIVIAQQISAKAVANGLFLSSHSARDLPTAMLAAAGVSLVAVLVMTRWLSRFGPARAVPVAFAGSGVLFVAEWACVPHARAAVAVFAYLHVAAFGGLTVSGFWSVVTERFDPRTAKRVIGRINAGGAIGGVVGGLLLQACVASFELRTMLLGLAAANVAGAVFVSAVAGPRGSPPANALGTFAGLRLLRDMPYLRLLGALVALTGAAAALSDFAFKSLVATQYARGEAMAGFFGLFYGGASLVTFLVQAGFARKALEKLGLASTVAILPGGFLLVGLVATTVTRIVTVVALRGVELSLSHSLYRSAYELFYTPLRPEKRRATKAIIDVAFDRAGDAAASLVVMLAVLFLPQGAASVAVGVAVATSAVALWIAYRLHAGYVGALGAELQSSGLVLAPEDVVDATTRSTLAESSVAIDRETLMTQIRELRAARASAVAATNKGGPSAALPSHEPALEAPAVASLARMRELVSSDVERSRHALAMPLGPEHVHAALALIARPELRRDALSALRRTRGRASGQIADALLDPATPASVRQRLPPLLVLAGDQRAADSLVDGLRDARLKVRAHCARALAQMCDEHPELELPRARLVDAAARELDRLSLNGARRDATLAHVFDLFALAFGESTLRLAWAALSQRDERVRGTALEYVESVLPEALCARLAPYLDDRRTGRSAARPRDRIANELRSSMAGSARTDRVSTDH